MISSKPGMPGDKGGSSARPHSPPELSDDRPRGAPVLSAVVLTWLVAAGVGVVAGVVLLSGETISNSRLLIAVLLAGAAGASLQAATALLQYMGWRTFQPGWTAYFLARPLLGGGMSLIVYIVLRAAFVQSSLPASQLNYYGILAISFLVGSQSHVVLARLTEFYDVALGGVSAVRRSPGVRWPYADMQTELRRLDRYHGFLMHRVTPNDDLNGSLLEVWLQPESSQKMPGTEVDIGHGPMHREVAFRVSVYPEECDVNPPSADLVAIDFDRSPVLTFKLRCPSGITEQRAYIELSQRGRTVAVATVGGVKGKKEPTR